MQIKSLDHVEFDEVVECFNDSFAGYFVKMPTSSDFWAKRWNAGRVDYSFSYGMFDDNKLVGFIINGIDHRNGFLTAFNSGTGVLPSYRGRKIVKQLYDYAIPKLIAGGIQLCALEVIDENNKAIKAYQSVGFEIVKTLKCYSGDLKTDVFQKIAVNKIPFENIDWNKLPNQQFYSWDNQRNAIEILKSEYECFEVVDDGKELGIFIINPKNGSLAQFDVVNETSQDDWKKLFSAIKNIVPTIKINNIDDRLRNKILAIENQGLNNTIDQYEMEFLIKTEN